MAQGESRAFARFPFLLVSFAVYLLWWAISDLVPMAHGNTGIQIIWSEVRDERLEVRGERGEARNEEVIVIILSFFYSKISG